VRGCVDDAGRAHAAADHDAAEEDDDRHDRRRHEQEDELLSLELYLVKSLIRHGLAGF
jgi:hypothetical protein